jgi:hypothetical protein
MTITAATRLQAAAATNYNAATIRINNAQAKIHRFGAVDVGTKILYP